MNASSTSNNERAIDGLFSQSSGKDGVVQVLWVSELLGKRFPRRFSASPGAGGGWKMRRKPLTQ